VRIKVTIHELLRHLSRIEFGQHVFEVQAATTLEALSAAERRFPALRRWTHSDDGKLSPQVWFFVNGERVPENEATRPVTDGDAILIFFNHI